MFAFTPGERFTIGRGAHSEHVLGETVTANYFQAQGVLPAAGRLLAPGDESNALAVIGYRFWRNRFLGDPAIAGKTIWINREAYTSRASRRLRFTAGWPLEYLTFGSHHICIATTSAIAAWDGWCRRAPQDRRHDTAG